MFPRFPVCPDQHVCFCRLSATLVQIQFAPPIALINVFNKIMDQLCYSCGEIIQNNVEKFTFCNQCWYSYPIQRWASERIKNWDDSCTQPNHFDSEASYVIITGHPCKICEKREYQGGKKIQQTCFKPSLKNPGEAQRCPSVSPRSHVRVGDDPTRRRCVFL